MRDMYYDRRRAARRRRLIAVTLAVACLLIGLTSAADSRLKPIVMNCAKKEASLRTEAFVNNAVLEILGTDGADYGKTVKMSTDDDGCVTAVSADTAVLNILVAHIMKKVHNSIVSIGGLEFQIPAGNVTGSTLLWGRGPKIPVKVNIASGLSHTVTSEFRSAGVNQTLHRIMLNIRVGAYVTVPFGKSDFASQVSVPLAETVIVGRVPDAYTVVIEGDDSGDIVGDIFDYGASTE